METTIKSTGKNAQEIEQEVLSYLNKTSKHLFVTEDKHFVKVIPVKIKDEWSYVVIKFNGDKCYSHITSVNKMISYHDTQAKKMIKDGIFPLHSNKKYSIINFRLMREKTVEIVKILQTKYTGANWEDVKKEISETLKEVKFQEKTQ